MFKRTIKRKPNVRTREAHKVITVRVPASFHAALVAEAHTQQTTLNKLCVSKLAAIIHKDNVLAAQDDVQESWDAMREAGGGLGAYNPFPKSKAFQALAEETREHHPACGCGPCLALSYWDSTDELRALAAERDKPSPKEDEGAVPPYKGRCVHCKRQDCGGFCPGGMKARREADLETIARGRPR